MGAREGVSACSSQFSHPNANLCPHPSSFIRPDPREEVNPSNPILKFDFLGRWQTLRSSLEGISSKPLVPSSHCLAARCTPNRCVGLKLVPGHGLVSELAACSIDPSWMLCSPILASLFRASWASYHRAWWGGKRHPLWPVVSKTGFGEKQHNPAQVTAALPSISIFPSKLDFPLSIPFTRPLAALVATLQTRPRIRRTLPLDSPAFSALMQSSSVSVSVSPRCPLFPFVDFWAAQLVAQQQRSTGQTAIMTLLFGGVLVQVKLKKDLASKIHHSHSPWSTT